MGRTQQHQCLPLHLVRIGGERERKDRDRDREIETDIERGRERKLKKIQRSGKKKIDIYVLINKVSTFSDTIWNYRK